MYLSDLSDADLIIRPVPKANHIAWQLGHLIASEVQMGQVLQGAAYPELPAGFAERHNRAASSVDPPKDYGSKADYLGLFTKVREATLAGLAKMPEADLDKATPGPMAQWAPTVGALLLLTANHTLMHVGQFTVVRRKLGKRVLF
jgi:hypothetical protein